MQRVEDVQVTEEELRSRTVRRADLRADRGAFLDTRIPGSEGKINYPLIGPGVSENAQQVVPVTAPHGFNLGAAVMPAGVVNNLHLHFTAEVFLCLGGQWRFRWGVDGKDGEATVSDGDVISIPTWIFRGFTSLTDDAWLFTVLGRDESGGLIWAPSVIERAAETGRFLTTAGQVVDVEPGHRPQGVDLVTPLTEEQLSTLEHVDERDMRERLSTQEDLTWSSRPFLDSTLPTGGAELSLVIGYGLTEDRAQRPRLHEPHGFTLAWLRADIGRGVSTHRIEEPQVLIVRSGAVRVVVNRSEEVDVVLRPFDTLSVPAGAWRRFESVGEEPLEVAVVTSGDGRAHIEWAHDVVRQAREDDVALDPNGLLAVASLLPR